jgi:hypothetical protein
LKTRLGDSVKGEFMRAVVLKLQIGILIASFWPVLRAQVPPQARGSIDHILGGPGAYIPDDQVYKVILPRPEATIVYDYQTLSPNLGLNSWAAFKSGIHEEAILTGQLLLLDDEVDSVISAAVDSKLGITGLAESSVFDGPICTPWT